MSTIFAKASDLDLPALANLFNDAFQGYVGGEVQFNATSLAHFLALEAIDLSLSDIAFQNDQPAALALIARLGWTSRLAAMGVAKSAQGQGIGKSLLDYSSSKPGGAATGSIPSSASSRTNAASGCIAAPDLEPCAAC